MKFTKVISSFFVLLVLGVSVVWYLKPSKDAKTDSQNFRWVEPQKESIELLGENKNCKLEVGPCRWQIAEDQWIEIEMSPRPFKPNAEISIRIQISPSFYEPVELDFEGLNLNMGYIRPQLKKLAVGLYEGHVVLPACEERTMRWKVLVLSASSNAENAKRSAVGFFFSSQE